MKTDPKARYQGYTFFFKEGFCWTLILNENSEYQKARLKGCTVNDVNTMTLYPFLDTKCYLKYFICLLNSYSIFYYKRNFISSNSAFQINDARELPIIIPNKKVLNEFNILFDQAVKIKKQHFSSIVPNEKADTRLISIQQQLDKLVEKLYSI